MRYFRISIIDSTVNNGKTQTVYKSVRGSYPKAALGRVVFWELGQKQLKPGQTLTVTIYEVEKAKQ